MTYHTCPACGHAYATEADWLACSYPANGRDLQDDCGGGLLRLRLCAGCESSMAKPVADVPALAIELQREARNWADGHAAVMARLVAFDQIPKACGWPGCDVLHPNGVAWDRTLNGWMCGKHERAASRADRLRDQVRLAYAHIGAAEAQLVDEDDEGVANHIRAAALILRGRS